MSIKALILFGSRARGDATPESDTDVLGWSDDAYPRHVQHGGLSLAMYPGGQLVRMAEEGDLFIAHLVLEAVPIHDPDDLLTSLRAAYTPPSCYQAQIAAASDFAWFLVDHHRSLIPATVNARAAWCARTIAIARTAEQGVPKFSPAALAHAVDSRRLPQLIAGKNDNIPNPYLPQLLSDYLNLQANQRPLSAPVSIRRYARYFSKTGNSFAKRTIERSGLKDEHGFYVRG